MLVLLCYFNLYHICWNPLYPSTSALRVWKRGNVYDEVEFSTDYVGLNLPTSWGS